MKRSEEVMEILEAYDVTDSLPRSCINDRAPGWPGRGNGRLGGENAGS
jgi:hypothetical protein